MIEVSITEIVLFAWAGIATVYAIKNDHDKRASIHFIHALMSDEKLRNKLVVEYKEVSNAD